jgi:copper(I)-binding protein
MMRFLPLIALALLAACGAPQPPLVATDVDITKPMPGRQMSAGYFVLTNNTDEAIVIDAVTSPQFGAVEIHETTLEDGISRMRRIEELVVPAHGSVTLERGGKHLMLMRAQGASETITLQLLHGGTPVLTIEHSYAGTTG